MAMLNNQRVREIWTANHCLKYYFGGSRRFSLPSVAGRSSTIFTEGSEKICPQISGWVLGFVLYKICSFNHFHRHVEPFFGLEKTGWFIYSEDSTKNENLLSPVGFKLPNRFISLSRGYQCRGMCHWPGPRDGLITQWLCLEIGDQNLPSGNLT